MEKEERQRGKDWSITTLVKTPYRNIAKKEKDRSGVFVIVIKSTNQLIL